MLGTTKTVNHQNLRNRLYAGFERLSHPDGGILDQGSLADTAYHCLSYYCHYRNLPYLEAQA